jgi:hypothetical protein
LCSARFQVFACPLRHDSAEVLKELKDSSHDLVYNLLLLMMKFACLCFFNLIQTCQCI